MLLFLNTLAKYYVIAFKAYFVNILSNRNNYFMQFFIYLFRGRLAQSVECSPCNRSTQRMSSIAWVIRFCAKSYWELKVGVAPLRQ